jgi:cytochrome c peroxidase
MKLTTAVLVRCVGIAACAALAACEHIPSATTPPDAPVPPVTPLDSLRARVLRLGTGAALLPPPPVRTALVQLGQALAFDPILSGPKNISCMTCHQPAFGTGDGRSLAVGQGGTGVGPSRTMLAGQSFTPRNAPALLNLSGRRMLFRDGRVQQGLDGVIRTPAGSMVTPAMTRVFEFGPLSAIGLFPVTDRLEMRGDGGNELASISDQDFTAIWSGLMKRLGAIPEYRTLFEAAYPATKFDQMTFAHASNAIAGFIVSSFTLVNSPFRAFVAGDDHALTQDQLDGLSLFVHRGRCVQCHTNADLSDGQFHNTLLPQIGPGKSSTGSASDDFGRADVTGFAGDQHRFRTASLLNVELTAPYGHAGEFATLEDFVQHYDRPAVKLAAYDPSQLEPALRSMLFTPDSTFVLGLDPLLRGLTFDADDARVLAAFLRSLTDPAARNLDHVIPARVPSGLPIDRP